MKAYHMGPDLCVILNIPLSGGILLFKDIDYEGPIMKPLHVQSWHEYSIGFHGVKTQMNWGYEGL